MSVRLSVPDTIVSFNAKVGRGGPAMIKSVREILDDHPHTDVLLFQECEGYIDDLRRAFTGPNKGWYVYCRDGWKESMMNPVMVRKATGFPKRTYGGGWGTIINKTPWIGPKHGLHHPGRTWTWVKVGKVHVVSLHRVTGGQAKNKQAYLEEARRLTRFFEAKRPEASVIVFGDTNTGYRDTHDGSMRDIRAEVEGRLIADQESPGIDYALTTRNVSATMQRTQQYGSDHKMVVMRGIKVS
jgi:hypothetical protein